MSSDSSHETAGADEVTASSDEATTSADDGSGTHEVRPKRLLLGAAALALASFIVAAVFGVMWLVTATGDKAETASAREAVVDSARQAVQAVTELDYQHPDRYFHRVQEASTEEFGKQLAQMKDQMRKLLSQSKITVTTSVADVGVQELNTRKGTATFLAIAKTHTTRGDKQGSKVLRLQGTMKRVSTDDGTAWKLAKLGSVPVVAGRPTPGGTEPGASGSSPAPSTNSGQSSDGGK